jgi:uncharacterized protein
MTNIQSKITVQKNVQVPMRDGINLSADIYFPSTSEPLPVALYRTPFDKNGQGSVDRAMELSHAGFIYVVQNFRGRYDSEGIKVPFTSEAQDGHDTLEWIGQ